MSELRSNGFRIKSGVTSAAVRILFLDSRLLLVGFSACLLSACDTQPSIKLYPAKEIVTMEPDTPSTEAVVVQDGLIVDLGTTEQLQSKYPQAELDDAFQDQVIIPGLIDPHVHMLMGALIYSLPFAPPWDMETPAGMVKGLDDKAAFLERLKELEAEQKGDDPLIVYGYHNLVHGDLDKHDLDTVSESRPVLIWHYSGHDFYLNSAALEWADVDKSLLEEYEGIAVDDEGELTGRLIEDAPKHLFEKLSFELLSPSNVSQGFSGFEKMLLQAGVTSVAELGYGLFGKGLEDFYYWLEYTDDDAYDLYLVPEHRAFYKKYGAETPAKVLSLAEKSAGKGDPKVLPQIKFFADAAFYSQTMMLKPPGYIGGQSSGTHGVWATKPELLQDQLTPYWNASIDLHIHSNGDAAQAVTLDAVRGLQQPDSNDTPRFIIEHAGLLRPEHIRAIAELGGGISAASHYVHYMGDDYRAAIGDRVQYITPLRSAFKAEIATTLHSDAPLAPPYPLRAASVHMTRSTRHGNVSTPSEKLSAHQGLAAVTINAAWSLGLEHRIGSIKPGKKANFTFLDGNPLQTPAELWPEIKVLGVMVGGSHHDSGNQ